MVFSNTTPFISLSSVGLLHVLPSIFGDIVVAPSVVDECGEGGRILVPDLRTLSWIKVEELQINLRLPCLFELDRGERDTLLLGAPHPKALVIMDEKLGRNMAEYLGLQVTGTLGVLAKARTLGLIPSFLQAAHGMREQGIYFHEGLVNKIAARIGETFRQGLS
jgi:predicted nucleic acid-binding protein